ncbi:MAG TPA: hypothetical protein VIJ15_16215 [Dermatophilaceae bacterium]
MKTMRTLSRVALAVLTTVALLAWGGCSTAAQAPCQLQPSGLGGYAVKFTLDGGTAGCPAVFGDWWGFDPYDNTANPAEGPRIIAVSAQSTYPDPVDAGSNIYAKGIFDSQYPAQNSFCTVTSLTPMTTQLFGADGGVTGTFTYRVHDMSWTETALYLGTAWQATVDYTNGTCAGSYYAESITPPIICTATSDCDPAPSDPTVAPSGINTNYNTTCNTEPWAVDTAALITGEDPDPTVGICFFAAPFPSTGGFKNTTP